MSDEIWSPCVLCRSGHRRVQHDHWQSFATEAALKSHLEEHLTMAQKEHGDVAAICQQWRFQEQFRAYQREASYDPKKSVLDLFKKTTELGI